MGCRCGGVAVWSTNSPYQGLGGFRRTDSQVSLLRLQGMDVCLKLTYLPSQSGLSSCPARLLCLTSNSAIDADQAGNEHGVDDVHDDNDNNDSE